MRELIKIAIIAMLVAWSTTAMAVMPDNALRVGTYNIRYSQGDRNTVNTWTERKGDLAQLVRDLKLDVFGMQEVCPDQAEYLRDRLPEFEFVGEHREADRKSGEASPVCYRRSRFVAEKSGTFWLSETPEVPASKSWNTCCTRVCSYLVLKDKVSARRFCFANTHTDHRSAEAREKGMLLIIERMKVFGSGAPIIFTGDHNCTEIDAPALAVAKKLDNALYLTETPPQGGWRTWNGWKWRLPEVSVQEALTLTKKERNVYAPAGKVVDKVNEPNFYLKCGGPRIDYIYVSHGVRVLDYSTVNSARPGFNTYPSDHFPVVATIVLP